jgi:UDP-N-acetylmuramyl pentapeptide phosphotransferase/UDP-N-acetylglucosamine-1-phosphate transferase
MDKILLSSGLSFIITFFAIPVIIQVAKDKKLFDKPDERKVHKAVIPTLGGLGIFAGFIVATLLGVPQGSVSEIQYFVAASIVIFFLGLKDDILILSATKKFAGQMIAAGILIKFGGILINNMHGFLGVYEIPHLASIVLTFLTIIVVTNSFNLIDGVDGLAGSIGILTSFIFGAYFFYINQFTYAIMAFSLTGSLIGFIIYNFPPARIFMGDTGSLLVGLINSILVIKFINIASDPNSLLPVESATTIGFAVLMLPLFDTLRVFGLRILNRRSPFSPDRNHIHHFLLDLGLSHKTTTLVCLVSNLFFVAIAFSLKSIGTTYLMALLFSIAIILTLIVYSIRERKMKKQTSSTNVHSFDNEILKTHKTFRLISEMAEAE